MLQKLVKMHGCNKLTPLMIEEYKKLSEYFNKVQEKEHTKKMMMMMTIIMMMVTILNLMLMLK